MDGQIQSAVGVEVKGKFSVGAARQRQDPLHPAGGQDLQGRLGVVAAQVEALVKRLIAGLDGAAAEKLIQLFPGPDGEPGRKLLAQLAEHPLAGIDLRLVPLPHAGLFPLDLVHIR